jgi:hypothetical protein
MVCAVPLNFSEKRRREVLTGTMTWMQLMIQASGESSGELCFWTPLSEDLAETIPSHVLLDIQSSPKWTATQNDRAMNLITH